MPLSQAELGNRVRIARESAQMTQDAMARALGVSRPTIVQIEQGNRSVTGLELQKLAFILGRDIREFLKDEFAADDGIVALFRIEGGFADHEAVVQRLRECIALGRELTNLEHRLGITRELAAVPHIPFNVPQKRWDAIQQGARAAETERRRLGLGLAPAPDMEELLETQGVRTATVRLPSDVSGLTIIDAQVGLFVVANADHHRVRKRFSFAHEYAHVLLDRERSGLVSRGSRSGDLPEIRANAFAAAFLMPEEGVRQFVAGLGKGRPSRGYAEVFDENDVTSVEGRADPNSQDIQIYDVAQVAHHFGVSRLTALYRLRNIKLITADELSRLKAADDAGQGKRVARVLGLVDAVEDDGAHEFRRRFLALALEAYRRGHITRGKLRQLGATLEVPSRELDDLVDELAIGDDDGPPVLVPGE